MIKVTSYMLLSYFKKIIFLLKDNLF